MTADVHADQPVILAGMHRSGTSLAASVLQAAGIDMGERLLGKDLGNERGHFEDMDFIDFHRDLLKKNGLHHNGWTATESIVVSDADTAAGRELIAKKISRGHVWGWKDPRTTLFLEFWKSILPGAKFVFLFRSPWEVVDSLFRRGSDEDVLGADPAKGVEYWQHYNSHVLKFVAANRERCAVVSNDALVRDAGKFVDVVGKLCGCELKRPAEELYDPKLMRRDTSASPWPAAFARLMPACTRILAELEGLAEMPSGTAAAAPAPDDVLANLLLKQWLAATHKQLEHGPFYTEIARLNAIIRDKDAQMAAMQNARKG